MSEFVQQLANMIAQARPQVIPRQGAAPFLGQVAATVKSPPLENVIGETVGSIGGQIAGRKLGEMLKKKLNLYNPEDIKRMKGEIDFIRDNMSNLFGEKKKAFMQRIFDPSIQDKLREFNELFPERFVPANVVTGDDAHSGYLMPVPKGIPKEKIIEYGKADYVARYMDPEKRVKMKPDEEIIAIKAMGGDPQKVRERNIEKAVEIWKKTQGTVVGKGSKDSTGQVEKIPPEVEFAQKVLKNINSQFQPTELERLMAQRDNKKVSIKTTDQIREMLDPETRSLYDSSLKITNKWVTEQTGLKQYKTPEEVEKYGKPGEIFYDENYILRQVPK